MCSACQHVSKQGAHESEQTKPQNNGEGMYFGLNQSCAGGQHYMTLARAASKETRTGFDHFFFDIHNKQFLSTKTK